MIDKKMVEFEEFARGTLEPVINIQAAEGLTDTIHNTDAPGAAPSRH